MHHTSGPSKKAHMPEQLRQNQQQRLSRIEGQVRGICRMVNEDRPCIDVLVQLLSVSAALNQFGRVVLQHHLECCVPEAVKRDEPEVYAELMMIAEQFTNLR